MKRSSVVHKDRPKLETFQPLCRQAGNDASIVTEWTLVNCRKCLRHRDK